MINTTGDLKAIIRKCFQQQDRAGQTDTKQAIKRAFQALRIQTNYELLNIQKFFEDCPNKIMDKNSLLIVITFQSLEEKLILSSMMKWKKEKLGELGLKKPLVPTEEEVEENSRSKSAKLFAFMF